MADHTQDLGRLRQRFEICTLPQRTDKILKRDIEVDGLYLNTNIHSGRELLTEAKLYLLQGHRYGLIGRNGVGKTTLLKAIHKRQIMGIYDHLRIVYIDDGQEVEGLSDDGVGEWLEGGPQVNGVVTALSFLRSRHEERLKLLRQLQCVLEEGGESLLVESSRWLC